MDSKLRRGAFVTVADLLVYCGLVALTVGAGLISVSLAFIVGGSCSVITGVAMAVSRHKLED